MRFRLLPLVAFGALAGCALQAPRQPSGFKVVPRLGAVTLSWQPSAADEYVTSYTLLSATQAWQAWSASLPGAQTKEGAACCSFDWTGLPAGEKRFFAISAVNTMGPGPATGALSARPLAVEVSWETKASMPTPRYDLGVAAVGGKLYAIGGSSGSVRTSNEVYDPATDRWTARAPLPTARAALVVAALNGKIYAIGGLGSSNVNGALSTLNEEYDPATDSWRPRAPVPAQPYSTCRGSAGTAANGRIYLLQGQCSSPPNAQLLEYDPATDSWATKAEAPVALSPLSMSAAGSRVFAMMLGGTGWAGSSIWEYSAVDNAWTVRPAVTETEQLGNFPNWVGLGALSDRPVAFGVQDRSGSSRWEGRALYYDEGAGAWLDTSPNQQPRARFATTLLGEQLVLLGGADPSFSSGVAVPVSTLELGTPVRP